MTGNRQQVRPLRRRRGERNEHGQQRELHEEQADQQLRVQLQAEVIHPRDQGDRGRRDQVDRERRQTADHLRGVQRERQRDDDGGDDPFAEIGAARGEAERRMSELARPGEAAAFLGKVDAHRCGAQSGGERHRAAQRNRQQQPAAGLLGGCTERGEQSRADDHGRGQQRGRRATQHALQRPAATLLSRAWRRHCVPFDPAARCASSAFFTPLAKSTALPLPQ